MMPQELHPYLVEDRKDGIISYMAAIIEVGNADGDIRREGEVIGQYEFCLWHGNGLVLVVEKGHQLIRGLAPMAVLVLFLQRHFGKAAGSSFGDKNGVI